MQNKRMNVITTLLDVKTVAKYVSKVSTMWFKKTCVVHREMS